MCLVTSPHVASIHTNVGGMALLLLGNGEIPNYLIGLLDTTLVWRVGGRAPH